MPNVNGVGRDVDCPEAAIVYFDVPLTDDEFRAFHDFVRRFGRPPAPALGLPPFMSFRGDLGPEETEAAIDCAPTDARRRGLMIVK